MTATWIPVLSSSNLISKASFGMPFYLLIFFSSYLNQHFFFFFLKKKKKKKKKKNKKKKKALQHAVEKQRLISSCQALQDTWLFLFILVNGAFCAFYLGSSLCPLSAIEVGMWTWSLHAILLAVHTLFVILWFLFIHFLLLTCTYRKESFFFFFFFKIRISQT